ELPDLPRGQAQGEVPVPTSGSSITHLRLLGAAAARSRTTGARTVNTESCGVRRCQEDSKTSINKIMLAVHRPRPDALVYKDEPPPRNRKSCSGTPRRWQRSRPREGIPTDGSGGQRRSSRRPEGSSRGRRSRGRGWPRPAIAGAVTLYINDVVGIGP